MAHANVGCMPGGPGSLRSLRSLLSISGATAKTLLLRRAPRPALPLARNAPRAEARGFEPSGRPATQDPAWQPAPLEDRRRGDANGAQRGRGRSGGGGRGGARGGRGGGQAGTGDGATFRAAGSSSTSLRLNKALAEAGVASRRGADEMVLAGRVSVNGKLVKEPGTQVKLGRDKLSLDGKPVAATAGATKYYFALNKPKGYICSSARDGSGGSGDRLVVDLFADWLAGWRRRHPGATAPPRLFTVGRLDVASIGLVLVTNDGDWAQAVQHPSSGLTKEYSVTLDRRPTPKDIAAMAAGCDVDGVRVEPVAVSLDDSDRGKPTRIRMVLAEGRNREVRRVVEAAGLEVRVLRRVRVGGYRMPRALGFGQFVELRPHEVRRVANVGADRTV